MQKTMIIVTTMMTDEKIKKLNQALVIFGKTRGLNCCDGILIYPSQKNLDMIMYQMKRDHIRCLLTESVKELLIDMDLELLDKMLLRNGISCLCHKENVVLGVKDDSLLAKHKPEALFIYADGSEISDMRAYMEEDYEMIPIPVKELTSGNQEDKLVKYLLAKGIDTVVVSEAVSFHKLSLLLALQKHGVQVNITDINIDMEGSYGCDSKTMHVA